MANPTLSRVLRLLCGVFRAPGDADAHLLERFVARREEEAFAELVRRHGPTVLGVCRRVLRDEHLAEDAFQATFLILGRKAAGIGRPEALGSWLYRVACRVSLRARKQAETYRSLAGPAQDIPQRDAAGAAIGPDERALLDQEVSRLPEKYRAPVVLCWCEGKTYEEAAARLGCPKGTVAGRLFRARGLLQQRLLRRGLIPAVASGLAELVASAAVPAPLADTTIQAGLAGAAGNGAGIASARAVVLMEGELRHMFLAKLKFVAAVCLVLGAAGTAAGVALLRGPADPPAGAPPRETARKDVPRAVAIKELATLTYDNKGNDTVSAVVFSPDGKLLLAGGYSFDVLGRSLSQVKIWDVATAKPKSALSGFREAVECVAISPDGKTIAVATGCILQGPLNQPFRVEPGELKLFDAPSGKLKANLKSESLGFQCVAFSPDGKTLAAGSLAVDVRGREMPGGVIRFWDVAKGKESAALKGSKGDVQEVAFSPDGKLLVSASRKPGSNPREVSRSAVKLWDLSAAKEKASLLECDGTVWSVAFSPDGMVVAAGSDDGIIRLWDPATGKELATLKKHTGPVTSLAFSPDGKLLASGGELDPKLELVAPRAPGELKVWDVAARKELVNLKGHAATIPSVAFDSTGTRLASGDGDGKVKLWEVSGGAGQ